MGVFEQDPRTKQVMLNTAMKGGLPLTTPMPGAGLAAGGQAAVATVFNRKKGAHKTPCPVPFPCPRMQLIEAMRGRLPH